MDHWDRLSEPPGYNTDRMNYWSLEEIRPLRELPGHVGVNTEAEVGYRSDGTRVYVKEVSEVEEDGVQSHIAASIFGDHLYSVTPDIAYDAAFGKILIEEMPGDMTGSFTDKQLGSFHRAAAEKLLMGDVDYAGNFLATARNVYPVDYDMTGRDLTTARKALDTAYEDVIDGDLLNQHASRLADQIDLNELETDLKSESSLRDEWGDDVERTDPVAQDELFQGSIDNILDNVKAFK